MLKSASIASVLMLAVVGGCATDEDNDAGIHPACVGDDAKCDAASANGFEIFQGLDGDYYFHLVAANGKIVVQSQGYSSKQAAKKGTESVRTNGVVAANFKVLQAANGEYYVNLYAQNHEVISTTETFAKKFNAERSVASVRDLVAKAQQVRAAKSGARFQTFTGADHQHYFQLRGANGEVMMQSEGYVNAKGAVDATDAIRTNGKIKSRYTVLQAANGQYFFHLQAANNEIIATGETYASKSNAQRAVDNLVALLTSELVAAPRAAAQPARSATDQTDLIATMQGLEAVADGGGGITYFSFAEQATRPSGASCSSATAAQAADTVNTLIGDVMQQGANPSALSQAQITRGQAQLVTLLGSDNFTLCTLVFDGSGDSPGGQDTYLLSTSQDGPKLVFQVGFE